MALVGFFGIGFVVCIILLMFSNTNAAIHRIEEAEKKKPLKGVDGKPVGYEEEKVWSDVAQDYVDVRTYEELRDDLDEDEYEQYERIIRTFGTDEEKREYFGEDRTKW